MSLFILTEFSFRSLFIFLFSRPLSLLSRFIFFFLLLTKFFFSLKFSFLRQISLFLAFCFVGKGLSKAMSCFDSFNVVYFHFICFRLSFKRRRFLFSRIYSSEYGTPLFYEAFLTSSLDSRHWTTLHLLRGQSAKSNDLLYLSNFIWSFVSSLILRLSLCLSIVICLSSDYFLSLQTTFFLSDNWLSLVCL